MAPISQRSFTTEQKPTISVDLNFLVNNYCFNSSINQDVADCAFIWCRPSNWTAGDQPIVYRSFDTTTALKFHNGAGLAQGKVKRKKTSENGLAQGPPHFMA